MRAHARAVLPALPAICCSALLGVYQLGQPSLWIDEAWTARAMGLDLEHLSDELHALYYIGLRVWTLATGTGEVALRLPSVVGAMLSVGLLYGLTKRMLGDRIAIVASLLLALNPFLVKWSQQARSYTFVVALAILTTWLLLRALERNDVLSWGGYGVTTVVMIVVHLFSAFLLLPVHVLIGWHSRRARVTWALIFLASLPWLDRMRTPGEEGVPSSWLERPDPGDVSSVVTSVPGALGVGLVLAVIGMTLVERPWRAMLGVWAFLPFMLTLVGSVWKPMFLDRYLIVSTPALAVLAAAALVRLTGPLRLIAVGVTAAATVAGLVLWYSPDGSKNWRGEDWRAATQFSIPHGGAEVVPDWASQPFFYYGGRKAKSGLLLEWSEDPADFAATNQPVEWFGKRVRALRSETR